MYTERDYNNTLCHYGIKGQKWGDRRFQNIDGSYTALGERHRLEQLARTGTVVRPSTTQQSREQAARTGNTVRINSTASRTTTPVRSTGSGTVSSIRKAVNPAYGSIASIQTARGKNALKKTTTTSKKSTLASNTPTARIVDSASEDEETKTTKKKSSSSSKSSTSSKKKSSTKSKKQKQQEAAAKKREQEAASTEEKKNEEEKKETEEPENLTDEQIQDYARRVIRGEFGNGQERREKLGANYAKIQAVVNSILLKGKKK